MQFQGLVWFTNAISRTGVLLIPAPFHGILQLFVLERTLKNISNTTLLRPPSNLAWNRAPSPPFPTGGKKGRGGSSPVRCDSAKASSSSVWSSRAAAKIKEQCPGNLISLNFWPSAAEEKRFLKWRGGGMMWLLYWRFAREQLILGSAWECCDLNTPRVWIRLIFSAWEVTRFPCYPLVSCLIYHLHQA